jgi:hypothetical protein
VWLNGDHAHRHEHFCDQHPKSGYFKISLKKGVNKILVRFEDVGVREIPHAMALQMCEPSKEKTPHKRLPATGVYARIPTLIPSISRRNEFEQVYAGVYTDRDVFAGDNPIKIFWPSDQEQNSAATIRLQTPSGRIYAEADVDGEAGDQLFLGFPYQLPEGPLTILLMPRSWEVYEKDIRITREISLWNLGMNRYSVTPYGTYQERQQEALANAARRTGTVFSEIARMALNSWSSVEVEVLLQAIEGINQRQDGSDLVLLGMLGMLFRFGNHPEFPEVLKHPLEDCILNFKYWHDQGDGSASSFGGLHYTTENHSLLFHACEILAGQRFPEHIFNNSGQAGSWHRQHGEQMAIAWLKQRGSAGFGDWDAQDSFADDLTALSHLIDLAEAEKVWEMAAVTMDKIFLTVALNSFKGVFGSTHGRSYISFIRGGFLEPTSGITRLVWGMGIFNHHIAGTVSLACMSNYELPSLISDIALSLPEEIWNREQHFSPSEGGTVNKVTYKTPDYMLCSAQDHRPGEAGKQEHIWQATLDANAVVFATHPGCRSEQDVRWPNFWAGNAILPRVAQWKDVLIAIHKLPVDDLLGFTHAYFPTYAFDEHILREDSKGHLWAFAKKGSGYLALVASQGFELVRRGHNAFRELHSYGTNNIWVCHMGRSALDGDFGAFQEKVLAMEVVFEDLTVHCNTLRGEKLSFGWQEPFLRDGQEQPLTGFKHYENPYTSTELPCTKIEIQIGENLLRLDYEI